ncbi:hypothetical protein JCM17823_08760 [Halorubrum gandharaense]
MARRSRGDDELDGDPVVDALEVLALPFVVAAAAGLALGRTVGSFPLGIAIGAACFGAYAFLRLKYLPT